MNPREPIAISGLGIRTALGRGCGENWGRLVEGVSGIAPITRFSTTHFKTRVAATVDEGYDPREPTCERVAEMAAEVLREALTESGLDGEAVTRTELFFATSHSGLDMERRLSWFGAGEAPREDALVTANVAGGSRSRSADPTDEYRMLNNEYPAVRLARGFGIVAPPVVVNTACATGATAVQLAVDALRFGDCDRALVVGSDFSVAPENLTRFSLLSALSRQNDASRASRPFSRSRDGFVMGEGAAAIVLETRGALRARGGRALAEVLGHADVTDRFHRTRSDPSSEPVAECMRKALADAGLRPEDVDCVNAHGTGTVENDRNEVQGIGMVFGSRRSSLPVTSNKSMIGHTLTAAGVIEAVFSVLSIREGVIPPTIHCEDRDERLEVDVVNEGARREPIRTVLTNSFGFGGQNVSVVLGAAP